MANHYNTTVIPARARRPKDKAKVESGVLQAERWILAPLRDRTFFCLADANRAIREKVEELNRKEMSRLNCSRRDLFESMDKPVLLPLPASRYEYAEFVNACVNIDYHVELGGHYYSVPYTLARKRVDVRATYSIVEILYQNQRVASHIRSYQRGKHTTCPEHMPPSHRFYLEWTPERITDWARKIGENAAKVAVHIMETRRHPEQGFRSCLGIIRLAKRYTPERVEAACGRALKYKAVSYRKIRSILEHGLENAAEEARPPGKLPEHDNIRGPVYFQESAMREEQHAD
jgi:transposase